MDMDNTSQQPQPQKASAQHIPISKLLLFLFAIGVPSATGLALAHTISQNPWQWVVIGLLYELAVGIVSFVGKVWEKLENPLVEQTAAWISTTILVICSRSWRRYRRYLIAEHQVFDIKGLSTRPDRDLELKQVYVQLNVDPTPVHRASTDPIQVPNAPSPSSYDIWRYLAEKQLYSQHFVIVGAPGSGKTTLVKHLALSLVTYRRIGIPHFPILLYLHDHATAITNKYDRAEDTFAYSLAEAVDKHIQRKWQQSLPRAWVESKLASGQCLILLDGLDEIADENQRKLAAHWVQRQMLAYGQNRFILTSRPYGYRDNPLEGVMVLKTCPFTLDQIECFVHNWYLANERKSWQKEDLGVHMRAREGAQDLLRRLHRTPTLLAFAVNPLLLTMIATVHRYRDSLPGSRVALYREICEVFLGKRREKVGITQELNPAQMQQVLKPLAYHLMLQGTREITQENACQIIAPPLLRVSTRLQPKEFLQMVQDTSSLVLEHNPGIYSFAHKTFQEYLAAVHIKEQQLEATLLTQVNNDWWHETIRLYCAQADATNIIQVALTSQPLSAKALFLAFDCVEEKLTIDPSVKKQLEMLLEQDGEDADSERRRVIAEALLHRRLERMVHLHNEVFIDTSLITCAEYQLFLDEQSMLGYHYQPKYWTTGQFPQGNGHMAVLGVQPSDALAFCQWLTEKYVGAWHYRLPTKNEQQLLETTLQEVCKFERDTGYWIEHGRSFAWSSDKVPPPLEWDGIKFHPFVFDQASDFDLADALTYAHALSYDLDLTNDLDQASNLAHTLINDLTSGISGFTTGPYINILANIVAFLLTNIPDLLHVSDLFYRLMSALPDKRSPLLSNDLARMHGIARAFTNAYSSILGNALFSSLDDSTFSSDYSTMIVPTFAMFTSSINIDDAIFKDIHSIDFKIISDNNIEFACELTSTLLFLCAFNNFLAILVQQYSNQSQLLIRNKGNTNQDNIFEHRATLQNALHLYIDCLILRQRRKGALPAWEGILLVKENKQKGQ